MLHAGHDLLLTSNQYRSIHPGSLVENEGCCDATATEVQTKEKENATECIDLCINVDTEEQEDVGACQYKKFTKECSAFLLSSSKGDTISSCEDTVCYSLTEGENPKRHKRGLAVETRLWPNNEIFYEIVPASNPGSWQSNGHSQALAKNYIQRAINHFHQNTNIKFLPTYELHAPPKKPMLM